MKVIRKCGNKDCCMNSDYCMCEKKRTVQINITLESTIIEKLDDLNEAEYNGELARVQLIRILLKAGLSLPTSKLLVLLGKPARDED